MSELPAEGGDFRTTLELVMSERLNHAFAIHRWATPRWQPGVARTALAAHSGGGDAGAAAPAWRDALLPSLLQPLLSDAATLPVEPGSRLFRLMLLSTDPKDHTAAAALATAALRGAREAGGATAGAGAAGEAGEAALLSRNCAAAARVIALGNGLANAEDEGILRLAAAATGHEAAREAALAHPPLAAAAAVRAALSRLPSPPRCEPERARAAPVGPGALRAWLRALAGCDSPARCVRLSVRAAYSGEY